MKTSKLVAIAMALACPALGCGDDSNPGGSGDTGTGSSTGAPEATTAIDSADESTTAVGTGNNEGGESSSSGEPPPVEVTVEGEVVDFTNMASPIGGAAITVFELPGVSAVSDAMGLFSIGPFMPDTNVTFVLAPDDTYWGAIIPAAIGSDPLQEDQQLAQIPAAFVDLQSMLIEPQGAAPPEDTQAVIVVRLLNNTAVMEGPTTITMDPPPAADTFYAPDVTGAPVLNQNTIEFAALPVVVYYNLEDFAPGDLTITAMHPTRDCELLFPEFPTLGGHITLVDVQCLPP